MVTRPPAAGAPRGSVLRSSVVTVPPDVPIVLAASVTDWIERVSPLVLFALAVVLLTLRRRERRRGPDEDDL